MRMNDIYYQNILNTPLLGCVFISTYMPYVLKLSHHLA